MESKLLPCPFCGEWPEIEYGSARDTIQCCNNMCPAYSPISYVKIEDDRKKAYKKWNTRADSNDKLREVLKKVNYAIGKMGEVDEIDKANKIYMHSIIETALGE